MLKRKGLRESNEKGKEERIYTIEISKKNYWLVRVEKKFYFLVDFI